MQDTFSKKELLALFLGTAAVQLLLARTFPAGLLVDLALIFTVYISRLSDPVRSAVAGMLFGLLQDAVLGLSLGINGISKTLIGFAAASTKKWAAPESWPARAVFLAVLAIADNLLVYGTLALLGQAFRRGYGIDIASEAALTAAAGVLIFQLYDRVKFPRKDFRRLKE